MLSALAIPVARITMAPIGSLLNYLVSKILQKSLLRIIQTSIWSGSGFEHLDPHLGEGPVIFTIWHEYLTVAPAFLLLISGRATRNPLAMCALVSLHKDGQMAGRIAREFGVLPVAGSTSRGGSHALKRLFKLIRLLKLSLLITPDGPRGPRRASSQNLPIRLLCDVPILPIALTVRDPIRASSWDRMLLPALYRTGLLSCMMPLTLDPYLRTELKSIVSRRLNTAVKFTDCAI